jgi:hypothetical protein
MTPIVLAATYELKNIIKILLKKGAALNPPSMPVS